MTSPRSLFLATGLLAFVIYLQSMAPTITWRNSGLDSGDLAAAVAVNGVPHPPGYPTYLVLGQLFKQLPFGHVAYRLNLLSASSAALAVATLSVVIFHILSTTAPAGSQPNHRRQSRLIWACAFAATVMLAFSPLFWSQAVITEVYALHALFVALLLYTALRVRPANQAWLLPALFGLAGLSLGNHLSILLLFPTLVWIQKARWHWRLGVAALLAFCLGLSVYLIIPLQAGTNPPVNWGRATTWPNFFWLVSAAPYRPFLLALPWNFIPARLLVALQILATSFLGAGVPLGLWGLWQLGQRHKSTALALLAAFGLVSIQAIGYNTTNSHIYLLPALMLFGVWLGVGLFDLAGYVARLPALKFWPDSWPGWMLLTLPILSLTLNFSGQNLGEATEAITFARQSLQRVTPNAIIVTGRDDHTFALWYGRYGLQLRPDVAVVNSHLLPYGWYRQNLEITHPQLQLMRQTGQPITTLSQFVQFNLPRSPLYLTRPLPPALEENYRLEATGPLYRVTPASGQIKESLSKIE